METLAEESTLPESPRLSRSRSDSELSLLFDERSQPRRSSSLLLRTITQDESMNIIHNVDFWFQQLIKKGK